MTSRPRFASSASNVELERTATVLIETSPQRLTVSLSAVFRFDDSRHHQSGALFRRECARGGARPIRSQAARIRTRGHNARGVHCRRRAAHNRLPHHDPATAGTLDTVGTEASCRVSRDSAPGTLASRAAGPCAYGRAFRGPKTKTPSLTLPRKRGRGSEVDQRSGSARASIDAVGVGTQELRRDARCRS